MDEHEVDLRILSVCHYVVAGIFFGLIILVTVYLIYGVFSILGGLAEKDIEYVLLGDAFLSFGLFGVFLLGILAAMSLYAGRCLGQQRCYEYCFTIAVILCMFVPIGTVLGAFTIVALMRPEVQRRFGRPAHG
ncbi:MAG: hypothetical protein ACOC29_03925 [Candidatus Sumerlaeota bacterium]